MMGEGSGDQEQFFYSFNLEDHIPQDHLLRQIDRVLDLSELRQHLAPFYSDTGRPSIDPELMVRMLLIGYCYGIRSERRLCEEVSLNLAYRWFCRLSIEDKVPDHSTFSKNRHGRFRDAETFRFVFEQVLERCLAEGLVGGEGFAIDASVVKVDASRQRHRDDDDDWGSGGSTRAVREYLEGLEAEAPTGKPAKKVSLTDPSASYTAAPGGPAFYAYSTNYLVDTDHGVIMDVEATTAHRSREVESTRAMVERVETRFGLVTKKLIGDTAYGIDTLLGWMVEEKGIEPHVPVWDKSRRTDGTFNRDVFDYDAEADAYTCPSGRPLRHAGRSNKDGTVTYRASKIACDACSLKPQCCPGQPYRKVVRRPHEAARDVARAVAQTPEYQTTRRTRKKVEMLFAHMKRILKMDRLRLRGMNGARDEFLLTATVQNLRRMVKCLATGPPKTFARVAC